MESKLNELGITAKYSGKSGLLHLSSRTDEYKQAITRWRPPARTGPWQPVPYQQGGNNAQGRLIAWATEYVERPPQELYQKILG